MTSPQTASPLRRRPALDGLRGVAALVVVVHHSLLTDPGWGRPYLGEATADTPWAWWRTVSPLRLLWGGDAAVVVFFVLSGYVLARPFLHGAGGPWRLYYPRRLVRLYLPVWGALAFAAALVAVVPRTAVTGYSWLDDAGVPPTVPGLLGDVTLAAPDLFLGQLWSLHWEVLFSLLLPVYLVAVGWLSRFGVVGFVPLFVVASSSWLADVYPVVYLSVFAFGVLLAALEVRPRRPRPSWWWVALGAVAVAGLTVKRYPLMVLGATAAVALVLGSSRAERLLSARPARWLGGVSYSLYLVHLPVVLAVSRLGAGVGVTVAVSVAVSLVAAAVFHRVVEKPSHRLASRMRAPRPSWAGPVVAVSSA